MKFIAVDAQNNSISAEYPTRKEAETWATNRLNSQPKTKQVFITQVLAIGRRSESPVVFNEVSKVEVPKTVPDLKCEVCEPDPVDVVDPATLPKATTIGRSLSDHIKANGVAPKGSSHLLSDDEPIGKTHHGC